MSGDERLAAAVITDTQGGILMIFGPADLVLELADPCRYRGLDGFMLAMEEDRLYRLRNPGCFGRHWHLLVVWGLALAFGWQAGLQMLVRVVMAAELYNQHVRAKQYYPRDWRAARSLNFVSLWLVTLPVVVWFFLLPLGSWGWQIVCTGVYCLGQWMLSHALFRMQYKYAVQGRMSARGWRKRLYRVAIGLMIMIWAIYFACL